MCRVVLDLRMFMPHFNLSNFFMWLLRIRRGWLWHIVSAINGFSFNISKLYSLYLLTWYQYLTVRQHIYCQCLFTWYQYLTVRQHIYYLYLFTWYQYLTVRLHIYCAIHVFPTWHSIIIPSSSHRDWPPRWESHTMLPGLPESRPYIGYGGSIRQALLRQ